MRLEGPPEAHEVVVDVWTLIAMRKPAQALFLARTLRKWFIACDNNSRGNDPFAGHYRVFLHGVELAIDAIANAKRSPARHGSRAVRSQGAA